MKQVYLTLLSLFFFSYTFAQTNKVVTNNGKWSNSSTWSLNRVPQHNDIVEVPKNYTLLVDDNISLTAASIEVKVYGTLALKVGKLDLGNNSKIVVYEGGIIDTYQNNSSDKITIGSVVKYTGAEGDISGPLVASKSTGLAPSGFVTSEFIVLPVKFMSFSVAGKRGDVLVQWSTAEEAGADYFEVERSVDGTNWKGIARVKAAGNSTQVNNYTYTDKNVAAALVYYRIKQADVDGKAIYTAIKSFRTEAAATVAITHTQGKVFVNFNQQVQGKVTVQVVNRGGQVVAQQVVENPVGQVALNTTASLKGNHFILVSNGQQVHAGQQIIL